MEIENVIEIEVEAQESAPQGLSAYEVYLNNGGTLSESEWLASLKGKDGTNGIDGADGLTPTIGENGNWYIGDVDTGLPSRGEKGDKGDTGGVSLNEVKEITGELNNLNTEDKTNLVNAINELFNSSSSTSWNDLTDKPFGESDDITLIAEQTVSLEGLVFGTATITPDYYEEFIEGETYIVKYKNQTYNIVIGEEYTMTNSSGESYTFTSTNTKIRFLDLTNLGGIVDINAENRQYKISDSAGSNPELIISLTRKGSIITIDEKFIPDNISTKEYVNNSIQTAIGDALGGSY